MAVNKETRLRTMRSSLRSPGITGWKMAFPKSDILSNLLVYVAFIVVLVVNLL